MKYAYNDKISKKANESLKRRVRTLQIRRKMLAAPSGSSERYLPITMNASRL